MYIRESKFNVEFYIVDDLERGLVEKDIEIYYTKLGFNVYRSEQYLKHFQGKAKHQMLVNLTISNDIKNIFNKYKNGYPDLLLCRGEEFKFVEIKLDGDSIRPNQTLLLEELSHYVETSVVYFSNAIRLTKVKDEYKKDKLKIEDSSVLLELKSLENIRKKNNFKSFWTVNKLYEKFDVKILDKDVIGHISSAIQEKNSKVVWYIKTIIAEKNNKKTKNKLSV